VDIGQSQLGSLTVLRPLGRIDGATSAEFQATLLQAAADAPGGVVVDFADVDYISSAGLRALMTAVRQRKDRRIAAVALRPIIQEIFAIARFQHVVSVFGGPEEAASAWGPGEAAEEEKGGAG